MSYKTKMQNDLNEMNEFDNVVDVKIEEFVNTVNDVNFNGLITGNEGKTVLAHKNRRLRVINRVIDKFKKEVEQYIKIEKESVEGEE